MSFKETDRQRIYLDYAATTPVYPQVLEAMLPYFTTVYGNPSAIYAPAADAERAVSAARRQTAQLIAAQPEEIYFTGGGSEADNWALKAAAEACREKGRHIVTTVIEHHAVLRSAQWLEKQGFSVTYVGVDGDGRVDPAAIEAAIRPDTILVSVMAANNEIGTIEPLEEIGAITQAHHVLFHTDAVQAYGHIPLDVERMHLDLLSASGHKLGGPKGIGFLYIRKGAQIGSFIHGGAQERGRRAGTLNVPGIVGLGAAAQMAAEQMDERAARETALRDHLIGRVLREIPYARLNGSRTARLPNNAHFSFPSMEGETMLIRLDLAGIAAASGSACATGSLEPSHVLRALGLPDELARGSLRLTLSEQTTRGELDTTADILKEITKQRT